MPSFGMHGPYNLDRHKIDEVVRPCVPGVYAVGYTKEPTGAFVVRYVGRDDSDVRAQLKSEPTDSSTRFKWVETASPRAAFEAECYLYHQFGGGDGLENEEHPAPSGSARWRCPVCDIHGR